MTDKLAEVLQRLLEALERSATGSRLISSGSDEQHHVESFELEFRAHGDIPVLGQLMRPEYLPVIELMVAAHGSPEGSVVTVPADTSEVNVANARAKLTTLLRKAAEGHPSLIRNARQSAGHGALLIGLGDYKTAIDKAAAEKVRAMTPERTLGEVLDSLPFSGVDVPALKARKLPGAGRSKARLPR